MTKTVEKQEKLMKRLGELLSQDLGYIFGERESGPNGAKKEFLDRGARFLKQLGSDLLCTEFTVKKNPAGIAVSGEVTLMGMWSNDNGIMIQLSEPCLGSNCVLYREISHLRDYRGGRNQYLNTDFLKFAGYDKLTDTFMSLCKKECTYGNAA